MFSSSNYLLDLIKFTTEVHRKPWIYKLNFEDCFMEKYHSYLIVDQEGISTLEYILNLI
jgi:hypothetical protein